VTKKAYFTVSQYCPNWCNWKIWKHYRRCYWVWERSRSNRSCIINTTWWI